MDVLTLSGLSYFLLSVKTFVVGEFTKHNASSTAHNDLFEAQQLIITQLSTKVDEMAVKVAEAEKLTAKVAALEKDIAELKEFNGRVLFVSPKT